MAEDKQRIDKWLWHARVVRTRSAAAALAASGHVRLNGGRVDAASRPVRPGDVLTIALDHRVRVLKVTGFAVRRGSAGATGELYEDVSPAERGEHSGSAVIRDSGSGRPTKQDRRAFDRLTNFEDG